MKAVILTRVSTKMQEEGLSLAAQSRRLFDYAERKGLEVIKHFEIIESSTKGERKQFMQMINFCKNQKETIAIVADTVDRVQRSFKESVLLDELMRKEKIELHFYRENMILNKTSPSTDIMRWDFSVMGAKAYVLQLSENVRRSTELKVRNGERCGVAPLGYENYVDERGKHNIRIKEPEASIIKQVFEIYSLGSMSVGEIVKYTNIMGLQTKSGKGAKRTTIYYLLNNPFYYGEMKTKRGLIRHIYQPLITKELWDLCQEKMAENNHNVSIPRLAKEPFVLKGIIKCGLTNKLCISEIKKHKYVYIHSYHLDGTRCYIPEQNVLNEIISILNRIHLPDEVVKELKEELKRVKANERQYCRQETIKLKNEQEKCKEKMDNLFDLRLEGEIDKETFDAKRDELQLKINRIKGKITLHEQADTSFNDTLLDLLDIATEAGKLFARSANIELKRLLLRLVFKSLTLTETTLTYELNFPFSEFEITNIKKGKLTSPELVKALKNMEKVEIANENQQNTNMKSSELQNLHKKQGVRCHNLTLINPGWRRRAVLELKLFRYLLIFS